MFTVLLTGAAGFIGRAVHRHLRAAGIDCVGIDRQSDPARGVGTESCSGHILAAHLADPESLNSLFSSRNFDVIVHLAAVLPGAASKDPIAATQVNIGGSLALLQCALNHRIRRFVFGSSTSVYGSAGTDAPISERNPAAPIDAYGAAKRAVEIIGEHLHKNGGPRFVALRMATVVGAGARNTSSPWRSQIFERLGTSETISLPYDAADLLTVLHVDDVAAMLLRLALAESTEYTIYNTPAELLTAGELKRLIESVSPKTRIELSGRTRPLAPLADGSRFSHEFGFQITPVEQQLRAALLQSAKKI